MGGKKKIVSVGFDFPGREDAGVECVPMESDRTLDADIIFFEPGLSGISDARSEIAHWAFELRSALENGAFVVVYLAVPIGKTYPSSYCALPLDSISPHPHRGREIRPCGDLGFLTTYWNEFGPESEFRVTLDDEGAFKRIRIVWRGQG